MIDVLRRHARPLLWLVAINAVLRGAWLWWVHPPQLYDFSWYYTHAVGILHGEGYSWYGHPTAYWPMGYPFFLAGLFALFRPSVLLGLAVNAMLSTATVLVVYSLSLLATARRRVAFAAALGYTLLPSQIEWNAVLGSEALYTCLLMAGLVLYAWLRQREKSPALLVCAGLCVGVSCVVRPIALLFPLAVLCVERWSYRQSWRRSLVHGCAFALGLAIGVMPATLRNLLVMHHFIVVSTNGGVDLWQGTHVDGVYFWSWDPKVNPLLPYSQNDVLQNQVATHVAVQYILHHPLRTFLHGLAKWFFLYWQDNNVVGVTFGQLTPAWSPRALWWTGVGNTAVYYLWMAVAMVGLCYGLRHRIPLSPAWWLAFAYVIYNTAIFFFFPAWDRFRYPIMPCLAVSFGVGWMVVSERWLQRRRLPRLLLWRRQDEEEERV
ncbi:hypothetical protein GCM10025857_30490 [Alicyclobacillus contaminans]|uniref:hypothetical protein n=1 Tax=Alicyclobacillus contaminans TaxID=392016 RepID=UPI0003F55FBD|nr:hypothetical protein [Alicyclobacillus contaminans]GMA51692.1 hypothetical protein GCM10025857_30490 [Alicyclobacillus contaminans]